MYSIPKESSKDQCGKLESSLSPEKRSQIINRTPMKRLGAIEDITPVVAFTLSEEAWFIIGQTIKVAGGITIWIYWTSWHKIIRLGNKVNIMDDEVIIDKGLAIGPSQTNAYADRFFYNLNPNTFSSISAQVIFDQHFLDLFKKNTLNVIVGTDSGLLPQYVQQKGIPEGTRYVFIEPSFILADLETTGVLSDLDPAIVCVDEGSWVDALRGLKLDEYFFINSVHSHCALGAKANAMDAYAELSWHVPEELKRLYYLNVTVIGMEPFIIQQLNNLADARYPGELLKRSLQHKTAFVLGGGPSLDQVLPWLSQHRQFVVIFAVSRVVHLLLQVGIEPDFFVSVDPQSINFDISKGMFLLSQKPIFIYANHVYSALVTQWPGRSLYLGERVPWTSPLNQKNISTFGPTVTNTAINCAYEFGCDRIFLAGVDYCYTQDGFTHAHGSNEYKAGPRFNLTGVEVETYGGYMTPTGLDYLLARTMLTQQVAHINASNTCQVFNVSLTAAKVEGIEYMPLSSITLDNSSIDLEPILSERLNRATVPTFFREVKKDLNQVIYKLKEIRSLAREALACNEQMYNKDGFIENPKDKKRLDKIERVLTHKYHVFSQLIKQFGIRNFLKMIVPFEKDELTADEVKQGLQIYYKSYVDGATRLIQLLEKVLPDVMIREEETKDAPDWKFITEHYRADKIFGRVLLWKNLPSAQHLSAEEQALFEEYEKSFSTRLKQENINLTKLFEAQSQLPWIKYRAQILFNHQKVNLLNNLLVAVDKHSDVNGVIPYRYLIHGYLYELNNDIENAIAAYEGILGYEGEGPIEEALLRIIDLDLKGGSGDLAHEALGYLSQLNKRYLLFYADSHRLKGNIVDAIDVYIDYLALFPDDLIVQLKLVQLYMKHKIYEGANMMLDHILTKHPDQKVALMMKSQLQDLLPPQIDS
jgi:hypothetical protein